MEKGGSYIVFFRLLFIVTKQVYPTIFYHNCLTLNTEVALFEWGESANTYLPILSPTPLHQEGFIII